jgi:hypothetical protein
LLPQAGGPAPRRVESLDALELTDEEAELVYKAEQRFIEQCMKERGFEYSVPTYEGDSAQRRALEHIAPDDVDAARAVGYGLAEHFSIKHEDPEAFEEPGDSEQQRASTTALFGEVAPRAVNDPNFAVVTAADGSWEVRWDRRSCTAAGERTLTGDDLATEQLRLGLEQLRRDAHRQATEHASVAQSLQRWQACAAAHGSSFQRPGQAKAQLRTAYLAGKLTLDQLRSEEIAAATIDAQCHAKAELAQVYAQAEHDAERELAAQNQPLLTAALAHKDAVISVARRSSSE